MITKLIIFLQNKTTKIKHWVQQWIKNHIIDEVDPNDPNFYLMKIKLDDKDSEIIKQNETYTLLDNTILKKLRVSKTILHIGKNTTGHKHPGQEEVYHFVSGEGYIQLGEETLTVRSGSIVLIPDGVFHKVFNTGLEDLVFVCVFNGKRNH